MRTETAAVLALTLGFGVGTLGPHEVTHLDPAPFTIDNTPGDTAMFTVNRKQFEYTPQAITSEASECGFAPGQWPAVLAIMDESDQVFLLHFTQFEVVGDNELQAAVYRDRTGRLPVVRIFND